MNIKQQKWPKLFPQLTDEQLRISDDFMEYWHTILPKYRLIEKFNNGYVIKNAPKSFIKTLEIGAGLGEHLNYERLSDLQKKNYIALDLRENMANEIKKKYPDIKVLISDCQEKIPQENNTIDRIIAIHVLEHLPNLPAAIKEIYRVCKKKHSVFSVVIPCEGGVIYSIARKLSAQPCFEKRYKQPYKWFIEREHINKPKEILEEISPYFKLKSREFFPFSFLPFTWSNLCIGMTFQPRAEEELGGFCIKREE